MIIKQQYSRQPRAFAIANIHGLRIELWYDGRNMTRLVAATPEDAWLIGSMLARIVTVYEE